MDQLLAGRVIKTGNHDCVGHSTDRQIHEQRDKKLGFKTGISLSCSQSMSKSEVLCAINKKRETLSRRRRAARMIAGTVALSSRTPGFPLSSRKLHRVTSLTGQGQGDQPSVPRTADPIRLAGALTVLSRKMAPLPEATWKPFWKWLREI